MLYYIMFVLLLLFLLLLFVAYIIIYILCIHMLYSAKNDIYIYIFTYGRVRTCHQMLTQD